MYQFKQDASKDVKILLNKDKNDESLTRYKQSLLGSAATNLPQSDDPRKFVLLDFMILTHGSKEIKISKNDIQFQLQEGSLYKIKLGFQINHEIVSGLQLEFKIWKKVFKIGGLTEKVVMGSYGPKKEKQWFQFPRFDFLEAPAGVIGRGEYRGTLKIIDNDGIVHCDKLIMIKIVK